MPKTRGNRTLRRLDRFVGIPAVALCGLLPKRPFDPHGVLRIGLMKTAAIGDTLLLAGLFDDVRTTFPGATLVAITGQDNAAAVPLIGGADEHLIVTPVAPLAGLRSIRRAHLDVLVDFGSWPRFDALLASLSGAGFRLGFETSGQGRHFGFDRTILHSNTMHERENYVRLLAEIGVTARTPPRIHPPGVLATSRMPRRPFVVFHAWPGGYMHEVKEWPAARWRQLADCMADRDLHVVLSGGPGDRARTATLAAELGAHHPVTNTAGELTLAELVDLLAASSAVVAVNTGVAHLAGLVGARTVTLEGPTPPLRWQPLGPRVRTVVTTLPNCGYLNLGFEYAGERLDCMDGVSVDAVVSAIDELSD